MKIDIRQTFKEYDGTPITKPEMNEETKKVEKIPIILREVISNIIVAQIQGEIPTTENLNKRDQLARKVYASNEPDFTLHDRTFILDRLPKVYASPRMFGLVRDIFDPRSEVEMKDNSDTVHIDHDINGETIIGENIEIVG